MSNLGHNFQLKCMRLVLARSHDMVAWTLLMTGQCDSWFNIEIIHRVKLFYIYHLGRISLCNSFIFYRKLIKVGLNTSLLLLSYFFCSNQYFSNSTTPKWSTVRCDFVLSKKVRKLTFHFIQKLFTTRCILLALIRSAVHFTSPGQIECCQATPIFNEPTFLGILLFRDHFFLGDWPAHSIWNYQLWSLWSMILWKIYWFCHIEKKNAYLNIIIPITNVHVPVFDCILRKITGWYIRHNWQLSLDQTELLFPVYVPLTSDSTPWKNTIIKKVS